MSEQSAEKGPVSSKKLIALLVVETFLGFLAWWALEDVTEMKDAKAISDLVTTAQTCIQYMGYGLLAYLGGQSTVDTLVRRARETTEQDKLKYAGSVDPAAALVPANLTPSSPV